jgi:pimeloyl-ACP methyl ester carboxylesterase
MKLLPKKPFNKNAFTTADLAAYKDAAGKGGAITAMLNYYCNIFQQRLLNKNWSILEVPTLMIWGEQDTALGKELTLWYSRICQELTNQIYS